MRPVRFLLALGAVALVVACGGDRGTPTSPSFTVVDAPESEPDAAPEPELSFIGFGSGNNAMTTPPSGDAANSLSITVTGGVAAGDFLLAQITFEKGSDAGTNAQITPSGWTLVRRTNRGSDIGQAIFWRVAASGADAGPHVFPFSQPVKAAGGILVYQGIDTTNPIVDSDGGSGDSNTLTAPSVNAGLNSWVVGFFGFKKKDTTLSTPGGMTPRYNFQNPQDVTIRAADELRTAGGETGDRVSTPSPSNSDKWVAQLVALRAAATVTLNKVVVPDTDAGKFDLRINGTTRKANAGHGEGTGKVIVPSGAVTVSELAGTATSLDDYVSRIDCDTSKGSTNPGTSHGFSIDPGENVVCTITNTRKAILTVNKILLPNDDPGKFNLQIDSATAGTGANVGHGGTTGPVKLAPGTHTVGEVAGTDTNLDDYIVAIGGACAANGSITLAPAQEATCTITNTRKPRLTVNKVLDPAGDSGKFNLRIDEVIQSPAGGVGNGGTTGPITLATLGVHTVDETAVAPAVLSDYVTTFSANCAGGSITLAAGQVATCTITNTRKATLTVNKVLSPAGDPGLFNLRIDGATAGTGGSVGNGGTTGPIKLAPGPHTVGETAVAPTVLSDYTTTFSASCPGGSITLTAGQVATCTITNTKIVVAPAGFSFYLHNTSSQPSAATTRQLNMPMNDTTPTNSSATPPNYDTNGDSAAGRLVQKGGTATSPDGDFTKFTNWVSPAFGTALVITKTSPAEVRIWTAMKDLDNSKTGRVRIFVRDCPGTPQTSCVLIGQADYTRPTGGPFSQAVVSVPWNFVPSTYTVAAGRRLELKVVARDTSDDDMWFGYDTAAMSGLFEYP